MKTEVVVKFDTERLHSYTDTFLAQLHHACQANSDGGGEADELAEKVKTEIVRRWLVATPPELYARGRQK